MCGGRGLAKSRGGRARKAFRRDDVKGPEDSDKDRRTRRPGMVMGAERTTNAMVWKRGEHQRG